MKWERYVLVFAAVIILWALGGHDLWAPDEPFFAEGAREMLVDGHWAVPHINGELNTHKPAFFFWLIALASIPFGAVTPWAARLPSALAALGTLALALRLGRRFYGPRTAATAGIVLCTAFLFWEKARWAQIEATLCFFIWVALSAFVTWRAGDSDGRRAGRLFWLGAALAVLAKGPVGLLLIVGIAVTTLACDGKLRSWKSFAPISGPVFFAVVVGAWMIAATVGSHGEYSVWGALKEHVIDRGVHGMHHEQPFWYYGKTLPVLLFPWSALAVGAVVLAWRRRRHAFDRFLLVAAAFVVLLFSISTEKRGLYVLPAFPAFALLIARLIAAVQGWAEDRDRVESEPAVDRRWLSVAQGITGALLVLVGAYVPFAAQRVPEVPASTALILGAALAATGIVVLVMTFRRRAAASALALAAGTAVAYLVVATLVYPTLEPRKSARSFALILKEVSAASRAQGHEVVTFGLSNVPVAIAFYSDGMYTVRTDDPAVLEAHLLQEATVYAAMNAAGLERLSEQARRRVEVLHRTRLSRRDVLLVANTERGAESSPEEATPTL